MSLCLPTGFISAVHLHGQRIWRKQPCIMPRCCWAVGFTVKFLFQVSPDPLLPFCQKPRRGTIQHHVIVPSCGFSSFSQARQEETPLSSDSSCFCTNLPLQVRKNCFHAFAQLSLLLQNSLSGGHSGRATTWETGQGDKKSSGECMTFH